MKAPVLATLRALLGAPPGQRLLLLSAILPYVNPVPATAETFDAVFRATLASIPVGTARLTGGIAAGAYTISIKGEASLLGFSNVFEASSNGLSRNTGLQPTSYLFKTQGSTTRTIEVSFAGGRAVKVTIEPQPTVADQKGRLPIELSHLNGVLDPMSALMSHTLRASHSDKSLRRHFSCFFGKRAI